MTSPVSELLGRAKPRETRSPQPDDAVDPLGPLSLALASFYLSLAFVMAAPVMPMPPFIWTITLAFPAGALLLAPRSQLKRVVFDGPVLTMAAWIGMSVLWTHNPDFGVFSVRRDLPLILSVSLIASLVPKDVAIRAIKRGLTVGIGITVFALITDAATRSHAADGIYITAYPGWHGYFIHKNALAPYLIFALITTLIFEKEAVRRGVTLAVIAVLLVGSDSATGLSAAIFIGVMWLWFRSFHRSNGRWTTAYVISSVAVATCALMVAVGSLSVLASAYGKDLTFSGRTFIWTAVLNAIQERPWVGYGVGGVFWDRESQITRSIWRDVGFSIPHSHSGALDVWLNFGAVGLLFFIAIFFTTAIKGLKLIRRSPDLGEWVLLILGAQFLMGLSENVFLGSWLVYIAIVRGIAQRELNTIDRSAGRRESDSGDRSDETESPNSVLELEHLHGS